MSSNSNLSKAKNAKNDEFYTQISDIEKELKHYRNHFKNAVVLCNCDDPTESNFWKFFHLNFGFLGLKKLITTHYEVSAPTYKMEYTGDNDNAVSVGNKIALKTNGDFRSPECIELLKEADIVVTNPPFSLFRDYIKVLTDNNKNFIVIGSENAVTYKDIFPMIKENKLWKGVNHVKEFKQPDGSIKKFGNICWFTNVDIVKRHEELILYKKYNEKEYPKYDNYNAINVDKVSDIPLDYMGVMGVPITFLDKYNPEQFEIIGVTNHGDMAGIPFTNNCFAEVNGVRKYVRIFIKRKGQNK